MVKARAGSTVILGLSSGNLLRLREGKPILFELSEVGLGHGRMLIVWGETEEAIVAELRKVQDAKTDGMH